MENKTENNGIGIGSIIDEALFLFSRKYPVYLKYISFWILALVVQLVLYLVFSGKKVPDSEYLTVYLVIKPYIKTFIFFMAFIAMSACIKAAINIFTGKDDKFKETIGCVLKSVFPLFLTFVIYGSVVTGAFLLMKKHYLIASFIGFSTIPSGLIMAIVIIPLAIIAAKYAMAIPVIVDNKNSENAFHAASKLAAGNYTVLISAVVILGILYKVLGDFRLMYVLGYINVILMPFLMVPFGAGITAVLYVRIKERKESMQEEQKIKAENLIALILLALILSPVMIYSAYPQLPEKIINASEGMMSIFSKKMEFPGGVLLKRPSGWRVTGDGLTGYGQAYYFLENPKMEQVSRIRIMNVDMNKVTLKKGKKDKKRKEKLIKLLYPELVDNPAMCAFDTKTKFIEFQGEKEYPKGIMEVVMKSADTRQTVINYRTTVYKVIKNRYVIDANFDYSYYEYPDDEDEEFKKRAAEGRKIAIKEMKEVEKLLEDMMLADEK